MKNSKTSWKINVSKNNNPFGLLCIALDRFGSHEFLKQAARAAVSS